METVRITKLLAERGVCSRREAEYFMERGWVFVDGVRVNLPGAKIRPDQEITLSGPAEAFLHNQVTILLHKPIGVVSGQAEKGYRNAVSLVTPDRQYQAGSSGRELRSEHPRGLAPAGRLDIDSHGLLVLTQDGSLARRLIGGDGKIEKEYLARVVGNVTPEALARLRHGLSLDGRLLRPAIVESMREGQLRFILREGRKRQIRRMCALVDLEVIRLKRVRIGNVCLGSLPYGKWRFLRPGETF